MMRKSLISRIIMGTLFVLFLLVFLSFFLIITLSNASSYATAGETTMDISNQRVTPGSGIGETTFLFMVTITSDEEPESAIEIVIDGKEHTMKEIHPEDQHYPDGKEFYYRERLSPGAMVYYYKYGNMTTAPKTLSIGESDRLQYHFDVAIIMGLFIIPCIYIIVVFRKIERGMVEIIDAVKEIGEGMNRP